VDGRFSDRQHRVRGHPDPVPECDSWSDYDGWSHYNDFLSDDSLLIVNRMVTKMSPLNRYFPLVGLETRLSKARPYCYVLLLVVFVLVYAHMKISVICGF